MGYPPQYRPKFDLAQAIANGDLPSATELATELFNAAASINEAIAFIRSTNTADQRINPAQLNATTFVVEDEQAGVAAQTEILYQNGVTVDPALATVGVFINGDRLPPSQVAVQTDRVVVTPALVGGEEILLEIHDNADSVFSKLQSTGADLGASLVGIEDIDGLYASANVEEALAEVRFALDNFVALVGDLSKYLKADVAIPWEVDQDAGGQKLTNGAAGTSPNDFVVFQQLEDIIAQFVDLGGRFLPIAGGVMNGTINMAGNPVTDLFATPTIPIGDPGYDSVKRYPATKEYVDLIEQSITGGGGSLADYLLLAGGTMAGAIDMASNPINNLPTPAGPANPATKDYVDTKNVDTFPAGGTAGQVLTSDGAGNASFGSLTTVGDVVHTSVATTNGNTVITDLVVGTTGRWVVNYHWEGFNDRSIQPTYNYAHGCVMGTSVINAGALQSNSEAALGLHNEIQAKMEFAVSYPVPGTIRFTHRALSTAGEPSSSALNATATRIS